MVTTGGQQRKGPLPSTATDSRCTQPTALLLLICWYHLSSALFCCCYCARVVQAEGFKNVSLGNVLTASYGSTASLKPVTFVGAADQALFKALKGEAFEVT